MERILIDLPDRLTGDRVILRPWKAGDGEELYRAVNESREAILPWLPWGRNAHSTPEESEAFVRRWRANWDLRDDLSMGTWRGDRLLGGLGLHRIDWNARIFEMGYWLRATEWGKGYGLEAARLALDLAFGALEANRVWLRCADGNDRSAALARRMGMQPEGCLRRSILDADGKFWDALLFGMLPEEYASSKAGLS